MLSHSTAARWGGFSGCLSQCLSRCPRSSHNWVGLKQEAGHPSWSRWQQTCLLHGMSLLCQLDMFTVTVGWKWHVITCFSLSGCVLSGAIMFNDFPRQLHSTRPQRRNPAQIMNELWGHKGKMNYSALWLFSPLSSTNRSSQVFTHCCCQKSALCTARHQGEQNSSPIGCV